MEISSRGKETILQEISFFVFILGSKEFDSIMQYFLYCNCL
ncbi:hypothetical protein EUBDOL_01364 [Amedibacillus dolichus DSM 3991]|uniref:Uncharacterized protein n=1 Tax=Amedibacillus dolichus DSM 3991 TaxID=428127 RepID=A8RCE4_9FIRM|nr:hypothetical protein EUBDOL_01364 [Amedibacillus dolichus DSM 3991]